MKRPSHSAISLLRSPDPRVTGMLGRANLRVNRNIWARTEPPFSPTSAFTLIELLASTAVLALLLAMVLQIINSTSLVSSNGKKRMDADSQARLLFDRMALDFARIVKRADVDYYFQKNAGNDNNDQMAFYSEATGYYPSGVTGITPKSGVSLIGYRVNSSFQLERLSKSLIWNGVTSATTGASGLTNTAMPMVFLPNTLTNSWSKISDGTDPDYQVIADQVYRLEYQFLLKPYTDASGTAQPSALSLTPWNQSHTMPNGLSDVSAIVVTVGILDNTSRKIVPATGNIPNLTNAISKLPDADTTSSTLKTWSGGDFLTASQIPPVAAAQIRFYQRYFYLNPAL